MRWARTRRADAAAPAALSLPGVRSAAHAQARWRVVHDMMWLRHAQALEATYPHTRAALGALVFRRAAARFIEAHPTAHHDLEDAGAAFPAFLAGEPAAQTRACAGLARIEWAVCCAFRAADPERAVPSDIAAATLALAPATHVVALTTEEAAAARAAYPRLATATASDGDAGQSVLVHRPTTRVRVTGVAPEHRALFACAARGASLAATCTHCELTPEELVSRLAPLLRQSILVLRSPCAP
jgi:hypothetical protein